MSKMYLGSDLIIDTEQINKNIEATINKELGTYLMNGYIYQGIAYRETIPNSTSRYGTFYIATEPGDYIDFGTASGPLIIEHKGLYIIYKTPLSDWQLEEVHIPITHIENSLSTKSEFSGISVKATFDLFKYLSSGQEFFFTQRDEYIIPINHFKNSYVCYKIKSINGSSIPELSIGESMCLYGYNGKEKVLLKSRIESDTGKGYKKTEMLKSDFEYLILEYTKDASGEHVNRNFSILIEIVPESVYSSRINNA